MLLLGVLSYNPSDIPLFRNETGSHNWIGPFGSRTAYGAFMYFGVAGYAIPFCILWIGISTVIRSARRIYPRLFWFLLALFCLAGLVDMNDQFWHGAVERLNIGSPGGLMGEVLAQRTLGYWIGHAGAGIVLVVLLAIASVRMLDLQIVDVAKQLWEWAKNLKIEKPTIEEVFEQKTAGPQPKRTRPRRKPKAEPMAEAEEELPQVDIRKMVADQQKQAEKKAASRPVEVVAEKAKEKPKEAEKSKGEDPAATEFASVDEVGHANYKLPPLDLLDPPVPQSKGMSADEIANTA
jgi:hypothetical protein